jgi:hypothetical protein
MPFQPLRLTPEQIFRNIEHGQPNLHLSEEDGRPEPRYGSGDASQHEVIEASAALIQLEKAK